MTQYITQSFNVSCVKKLCILGKSNIFSQWIVNMVPKKWISAH